MPDPFGPGWALGANRPPAGRMTRAGRPGTSTARGTFAGRTVAGGLSSGTGAHGGHGCPTTKGPGRAVDAARPGRDPHARVFEGGRVAFRADGSSRPRRISGQLGLDFGREQPLGHRQAHRRSHDAPGRPATSKHHGCRPGAACDFAGPGVRRLDEGPRRSRTGPRPRSATSVGPRQRHFRFSPVKIRPVRGPLRSTSGRGASGAGPPAHY